MKKGFFLTLLFLSFNIFASNLSEMNFYQSGEVSQLELVLDKEDVKASKFHMTNDKQIIIDLKNVKSTKRVMRAFDTSEFSGSVVFVSAYQKKNTSDIRVVVQLRDNVRSILERRANRVVLNIENRFGVFTQAQLDKLQPLEDKINEPGSKKYNVPKSNSIEDILENLTMSGKKKYAGKRISINVKNVNVEDVLKMISDASGFNIIITDEIKALPPLTLSLNNVPWDQALDTILEMNKLVASKNGGILSIVTLAKATRDKQQEINAKRIVKEQEPLVTKIFPISFGDISKLEQIVKDYLTPERGKVSKDDRTNYLIVKDTVEVIEKVGKILETLDTATAQVLIETKIIDVTEGHAKSIGLTNGLAFGYDPIGERTGTLGTIGTGTVGTDSGPGFSFSSTSNGAFLGLNVATFKRLVNLDFNLELLESENKAKIISNPKVITQNKQTATINARDTTFYLQNGETDAGNVSNEWVPLNTDLSLDVTPQVTNDGSISMDVKITKQEFTSSPRANDGPPNTGSRDIKTKVLVDNGSTVVIGGIYKQTVAENHQGVPFLKDLPLVGWLFRTPHNPSTTKSELIIFLTPRIINQEEAGLGTRI